jgi:hypothetical protein
MQEHEKDTLLWTRDDKGIELGSPVQPPKRRFGNIWSHRRLRWSLFAFLVTSLLLVAHRGGHLAPTLSLSRLGKGIRKDVYIAGFTIPNTIPHPTVANKSLIYDAFFSTPNNLVVMTPSYDKSRTDFEHALVYVNGYNVSGRYVEEKDEEGRRYPLEPLRVITYSLNHPVSTHNKVEMEFEGIKSTFTNLAVSSNIPTDDIAIATLVGDGFDLQLAYYIEHYRLHGVTRFEIYYNGKITPDVMARFPKLPGVHYHEWPFNLWYNFLSEEGLPMQTHNAQTAVVNSVVRRVLPEVEWLILCDIDELIHFNSSLEYDTKLVDYLGKLSPIPATQRINVHLAVTSNTTQYEQDMKKFALAARDGRITSSSGKIMDRPLIVQPQAERSTHKTIYHRSFHGLANVHLANQDYNGKDSEALRFAHLVEVWHPTRLQEYHGEMLDWQILSHL